LTLLFSDNVIISKTFGGEEDLFISRAFDGEEDPPISLTNDIFGLRTFGG
jgi:hypothetical protein